MRLHTQEQTCNVFSALVCPAGILIVGPHSVAGGLGKGRASLHIKTAGTGTWTLGGGHTILNSVRSGPLCDANLSLVSVPSFRGARTKG